MDFVALLEVAMKYKVLYLTYHPQIGGGETTLLSLITHSAKINPFVVITKKGPFYKELKSRGIPVYIIPFNGYLIRELFIPGFSLKELKELKKLTDKIKPDIIHVNHLNLIIYAGMVGKICKIPVVATTHGVWDSLSFIQDMATQICTTLVLANTIKTRNSIINKGIVNKNKVKVIQFGIDTNRFRPQNKTKAKASFKIAKNTFVVSIIGRIDPVKDHITFFKAASYIIKEISNVQFLVAGSASGDFSDSDYFNKLKEFLKVNPTIKKKIIFTGFIKDIEIVYNASDVVVSSSLSESFGLTSIEAGSCQTPVVATNTGSQIGLLVPANNPKALSAKVILLLKNKKLREELGTNLRKLVLKDFNINRYIKFVETIYTQFT